MVRGNADADSSASAGPMASMLDSTEENGDKVKTKLICLWNHVKYSSWNFKTKTQFAKDSPIWLLGRLYHDDDLDALREDFSSRIWLTYRRQFPALDGSHYTSDCGWGCMLRSGQMLLAQALIRHFLGRDWRWRGDLESQASSHGGDVGLEADLRNQESLHRGIVQWFGDSPSPACPLSIHQMVSQGYLTGKRAGDWYGPASVSYILKQILLRATDTHPELDTLRIYVAQDCTVYLEDVRLCCSTSMDRGSSRPTACLEPGYEMVDVGQWKSLVLLIPLRLGSDRLNVCYEACLKGLLSLDQCIGIIGGKPKHSLYFVGWQDDYLIHLDPHHNQDMVDVLASGFSLKSFHCREIRKTSVKRMDPSCCVGFYLRSRSDLDELQHNVQHYLVPPDGHVDYPIFAFSHGSSPHVGDAWLPSADATASQPPRAHSPDANADEDFEFL